MSIEQNHLDAMEDPQASQGLPVAMQLGAVIALPLIFMVAFTLCMVSALHSPAPHHLALTIAGPTDTTAQVARSIDQRAEGAFDITRTTSAAEARTAVKQRGAVGAIVIEGTDVTTVIASAGGRTATAAVTAAGQQIAAGLGGTSTDEDVAPVTADDTTATALFYLLIICTIGSYLCITMLQQVLPKARLRLQLAAAVAASVLVPLVAFAAMSPFVGDYGAQFSTITAVLGVAMIYSFTVAMLAVFFVRLLGPAAILALLIIVMAVNFPSSGGPSPESMLPGFWQGIHNGWFGAGAMETIRSIVYFDGHQVVRWLIQLLIWTSSALVLTFGVRLFQKGRERRGHEDDDFAPDPDTAGTEPVRS